MLRKPLLPILVLFIVVLGAFTGYWLWKRSTTTSGKAATPQRVRIAQFGDFFLYAPIYIAMDKGYFAAQGLDVTVFNTGGDEKTWAAILSGDATFGVADPTFIAIANERGREGRVIASVVTGVPFWGVTTQPDLAGLDDLSALDGRTIATFPSPSTAFALQTRLMKEEGVTGSIREVAPGGLLPLLWSGQVDIALELEPSVSLAVARGAQVSYSLAERFTQFVITGLTTLPSTCQASPGSCFAVVCALQQSVAFIKSDLEAAADILAVRFSEVPRDVALAALQRAIQEDIVPATVTVDEAAWRAALELRHELGELRSLSGALPLVDNSFAVRAAAECNLGD